MLKCNFPKPILKLILLTTIALLLLSFSYFPNLILSFYSNGLYIYISALLKTISSVFPFALGDFIYLLLIIYGIRQFILFLKNKKSLTKNDRTAVLIKLINTCLALYICFKLLWGLNYNRPTIANPLHIKKEKYTVKQLVLLGSYFVSNLNELQPKTTPNLSYSITELEQKATIAYQLSAQQNLFFKSNISALKPVLNDYLTSKIGIEGYYNPITGEANINMNLPAWVLPFVTCHEIAHQMGVAREDEANLVGYLVGINSNDVNFQYSANYNMLRYILFEISIKSPKDYKKLRDQISPGVLANFKAEKDFWAKYNGQMANYMGFVFDKFLKLNNQKKGINSYQDIVIWLWNIHREEVSPLARPLKGEF